MDNKVLLVKCEELGDQFECDADRIIIGVYNKKDTLLAAILKNKDSRYEVYDIRKDGRCILNKDLSTYEY